MDLKEITGSSMISHAGYDPDTKELHVRFHNGATYAHYDVPQHVHDGLQSADSAGSHYSQYIRGQFRTERVG